MMKIVCLIGSTAFHREYVEANLQETLAGNLVLSVGCFHKSGPEVHGRAIELNEYQIDMLDSIHRRKIDLAHEVVVVTRKGLIDSKRTEREIQYAHNTGKIVRYWSEAHG